MSAEGGRAELDEIAATLEALRAAVRLRSGYLSASEVPPLGAQSPVAQTAELAQISAHLPVTWQTPILGHGLALAKRALRIGLRWYINPIVEQQNAFNDAVVRALTTLEVRQREIERRLESSETGSAREPGVE